MIIKQNILINNNNYLKSLSILNNYLIFKDNLGINYLDLNDPLFTKLLEYCIFYNKFLKNNNPLNIILLRRIKAVSYGFYKELIIAGLGFRLKLNENGFLLLNLGYNHAIALKIPSGIKILVVKGRALIFSLDLIILGCFVDKIIKLRPFNKYKDKGVRLSTTEIKLKEGKKQKV